MEGLTDGMRYAASAILVYAVAFAFFDTKAYRTAWFMPAIASLLCALTGIICRGGDGWHGEALIYFVTEVLCAGGAALAYRVLFLQWPETLDGLRDLPPKETAGVLVLGGTVLMSLARVELLGTFSLGRLLAAVGVMWAARRGPGGQILDCCLKNEGRLCQAQLLPLLAFFQGVVIEHDGDGLAVDLVLLAELGEVEEHEAAVVSDHFLEVEGH